MLQDEPLVANFRFGTAEIDMSEVEILTILMILNL